MVFTNRGRITCDRAILKSMPTAAISFKKIYFSIYFQSMIFSHSLIISYEISNYNEEEFNVEMKRYILLILLVDFYMTLKSENYEISEC